MKARISYSVLVFLFCALSIQASDIHILASKGDTQAAQELLKNLPTETCAVDGEASAPLHFACRGGHSIDWNPLGQNRSPNTLGSWSSGDGTKVVQSGETHSRKLSPQPR